MRIASLNIALPSVQRYDAKEVLTGGAKKPVPRAMLRFDNFDGDGQADRVNHGGPDKAGCVYPADHYAHWKRTLGRELSPGAFSEDLTVSGTPETEVCIGDVFRIGEVTVQTSQPRMPCNKLAEKNGERLLARWVARARRIERHPDLISVADVNDVIYERSHDLELIEQLAVLPEFAAGGRAL